MNLKYYKAAAERTDEAERLLIPAIERRKIPIMTTDPDRHDEDEAEEYLRDQLAHYKAHYERLNRELPKMREENQRLTGFIRDANAYINEKLRLGTSYGEILGTLCHDLGGLERDEPCFLPKVTGYCK